MGTKRSEVRTIFAEEIRRGSSRAWYRISILAVPVILLVMLVAVPVIRDISASDEDGSGDDGSDFGLVDRSGLLTADSASASGLRMFPGREAAVDALLEGEVKALYVVPQDYVSEGIVEWIHTRSIVAAGFARGMGEGGRVSALLREALVKDALDPEAKRRFLAPASFESVVLKDDRSVEEGAGEASAFSVSYIFMVLMLVSVVAGSMMLLESVSEEKQDRMIEILVTSVTPLGIMAGKVFALGTLGLLQVMVWAASLALLGPHILEDFPELDQLTVDPLLLVWMVAFFLAGYFVMSVVMAGIGAASTSLRESRQVAWLVLIPAYVPLVFWPLIMEHPDGGVARALSFIPITAPATMMIRLGDADVALVETLASLIVTVASGLLLLWGSARVFRAGLLMYGQRMSLGRVLTALRQAG